MRIAHLRAWYLNPWFFHHVHRHQYHELCMHNLIYLCTERLDLEELDLWLVSFGLLSNQDRTNYHVSLRFLTQPMSQGALHHASICPFLVDHSFCASLN